MNFIDIKKQLPANEQIVFVKVDDDTTDYPYAMCQYHESYTKDNGTWFLGYFELIYARKHWFSDDYVLGWIPLDELNKIEVK